jgi:FMN phosphatase YigB (HAD superfamily)
MPKKILIDYGGTIDTNGLHWATVLQDGYAKFQPGIPGELFSKAYSFGERSLAIEPVVKPSHDFLDVLRLKIQRQFSFLKNNGCVLNDNAIELIAEDGNCFAKETITKAIPVLQELHRHFPLVMVSNFYGNLNTVLETFGIRKFFTHIVESAVVGIRKPDAAIYRYGIDLLKTAPAECIVIGDSFAKDIVPAKQLGCTAIWLNAKGWEEDKPSLQAGNFKADIEIKDFADVVAEIRLL